MNAAPRAPSSGKALRPCYSACGPGTRTTTPELVRNAKLRPRPDLRNHNVHSNESGVAPYSCELLRSTTQAFLARKRLRAPALRLGKGEEEGKVQPPIWKRGGKC